MVWICRALFLFCYALYWGGLTFYTGFVVRISHDVLNDPMDGGLITQRVTVLLQIFGAVCVLLMLCNAVYVRRLARRHALAMGAITTVLGVAIIGLFVVHGQLDAVINVDASEITDRDAFTIGHRWYNRLTAVQWIAAVLYLPIAVDAWRRVDKGPS